MEAWTWWLVLAGLIVICELMTGTFYLLMISTGMFVAALVSIFGLGVQMQILVAAVVSSGATLALHRSRFGWQGRSDAARDPSVNIDIGQQLRVDDWSEQGSGVYVARTKYRGAMWDVELRHSAGVAGMYVIDAVEGSRLIVRPV